MNIAIDIDSTLHHYWDQLSDAAQRRFGIALPVRGPAHLGHHAAAPRAGPRLRRGDALGGARARRRALPGRGRGGRARWHAAGHFIHITSHRATDSHDATERWLRRIELPYDELYCSYDKVARCREIGIDVLIDDSPVNLERALEAGITAATLLHPWNRELCETEDVICGAGLARAGATTWRRCSR